MTRLRTYGRTMSLGDEWSGFEGWDDFSWDDQKGESEDYFDDWTDEDQSDWDALEDRWGSAWNEDYEGSDWSSGSDGYDRDEEGEIIGEVYEDGADFDGITLNVNDGGGRGSGSSSSRGGSGSSRGGSSGGGSSSQKPQQRQQQQQTQNRANSPQSQQPATPVNQAILAGALIAAAIIFRG